MFDSIVNFEMIYIIIMLNRYLSETQSLKHNKGLFDSIHKDTSIDIWPLLLKEHNNG